MVSWLRRVFPDLWLKVDEIIGEGDAVAAKWTSGGTQRGEWKTGVPPTEKKVEWSGISIYHLKTGRIVDEGCEENMLGLLEQIGVVQRK
jgi:predicted ester cyclase